MTDQLPALPTETALTTAAPVVVENNCSANDIAFPKLWLMQGLSDAVSEGKAKFGDILNAATGEVIANAEQGINIVPIHMTKVHYVSKMNPATSKYEFSHTSPIVTAADEKLPWDFVENGVKYKRDFTRIFYVLLESDPCIPYILQMRGASAKTGQRLATQMYIMNKVQAPNGFYPGITTIKLGGAKDKNDKGTFYVWNFVPVAKTSAELLEAASNWYTVVKQMDIREQMEPVKHEAVPVEVPKDANGKDIF